MYYFIVNPNSRSGNGLKIWHNLRAELDKRRREEKIDLQAIAKIANRKRNYRF